MMPGSILSKKISECCNSNIFWVYIIKASTFNKDVFSDERIFTFLVLVHLRRKGNGVLNLFGQFDTA